MNRLCKAISTAPLLFLLNVQAKRRRWRSSGLEPARRRTWHAHSICADPRQTHLSVSRCLRARPRALCAWQNYARLKELIQKADKEECNARGLEGRGPSAYLRRYLRQLAERGEPLPLRLNGNPAPCEFAIARLAGLHKAAFRRDPTLRELVRRYQNTWEAAHPDEVPLVRAGRAMVASRQSDSM
jgi:hypothetical protein